MTTLRRAGPDDAPALVALRALMHEEMGTPAGDPAYRQAAERAFRERLAGDLVAVVVADGGEVVSCGVLDVQQHLPSPTQLDGRRGHVSSMSTAVGHRRRGHARAVLIALLEEARQRGLARVDLRATPDGQPLYSALGFRVLGGATMAWTAPGVRPGMPR